VTAIEDSEFRLWVRLELRGEGLRYQADPLQLGKIRPLLSLSEKRVTKAVREELRKRYGFDETEVACDATYSSNEWRGKCRIAGEPMTYTVSSS
jgi:hypothetical protein